MCPEGLFALLGLKSFRQFRVNGNIAAFTGGERSQPPPSRTRVHRLEPPTFRKLHVGPKGLLLEKFASI